MQEGDHLSSGGLSDRTIHGAAWKHILLSVRGSFWFQRNLFNRDFERLTHSVNLIGEMIQYCCGSHGNSKQQTTVFVNM